MHIIKSKNGTSDYKNKKVIRINQLLFFNLYYMKGKDMILSDFLSQQINDDSNPNEIIPISFYMCKILENNLENFSDKYLIQMQSQAKSSGIKLLEVHGVEKSLNPNLRPEKQHTFPKQGNLERPQIGQGTAGSKRKKPDPINQAINKP